MLLERKTKSIVGMDRPNTMHAHKRLDNDADLERLAQKDDETTTIISQGRQFLHRAGQPPRDDYPNWLDRPYNHHPFEVQ